MMSDSQLDAKWDADRCDIWSYYAYCVGNNDLRLFNFAPSAFQSLLVQAAGDKGVLVFAGRRCITRERTVNRVTLLSNGISFAIQIVVFLFLGSFADFGTWRPNILISLSLIAWGIGFGWLGVHDPTNWKVVTGIYIVGYYVDILDCGVISNFVFANERYRYMLQPIHNSFPVLARNTPKIRHKAAALRAGRITRKNYDYADTLEHSELSKISFYVSSLGEIVILAIIVDILFALRVNDSPANNNRGLSVVIGFETGMWILLALPSFFLKKKRRAGQEIPASLNILSVGFWQLSSALSQIIQLKQSLIYLLGYFLLGDSLTTSVTVISTLQNNIVSYNTLSLAYLLIVGITAQAMGIWLFWQVQRQLYSSAKTMFNLVACAIIMLDLCGMIGIWTTAFGFHHTREIWAYQVFYGVCVCPWYSYSQMIIAEVTPRGKEFLFFSLFSIVGTTTSVLGPLVSREIIDRSAGNPSTPLYFLAAMSLLIFGIMYFFWTCTRAAGRGMFSWKKRCWRRSRWRGDLSEL